MRLSRRCLCLHSRRRWFNVTLVSVALFTFAALSCLLYMALLLEKKNVHELSFINVLQSQIKDDILDLNDVEEIVFQGEESIPPVQDFSNGDSMVEARKKLSVLSNDLTAYTSERKNKKKIDPTWLFSSHKFSEANKSGRYLFILGHYEQLGKTTINFMHAGLLASIMHRDIVIPLVMNSRFCGLQSGWTGPKRKKSREFLPMDNYFDVNSLERIFYNNSFARLSSLAEFNDECSFEKNGRATMIYFLYTGTKVSDKRYMQLKESEYVDLELEMKENYGWTDCQFILKRLNTGERLKHIMFTRAICVDPERIRSIDTLESLVYDSKCVSIFLWRGIGFQRTHFNLTLPNSHEAYLSQLDRSAFVFNEVNKFLEYHFLSEPYLSVQIRSERQLSWYGLNRFEKCMTLVSKVLNILMAKKKIKHVFFASDLERHGSDQLSLLLTESTLTRAKLMWNNMITSFDGVLYKPDKSRGLIYNDAGFVALTQMEIISRSRHLITLGDGTFQSWIISVFKKYRKMLKVSWSLTRVCSVELKNSSSRSKTRNSTST